MKRLTPFQAIRRECRFCRRTTPDKCLSDCVLNKKSSPRKSPTGRIWSYCRQTCPGYRCDNGDQIYIIGTMERCWLLPFRNGKNPYLAKRKVPREKIGTEKREGT
jgi:hypothetical protein